jgi:hypothetical protein
LIFPPDVRYIVREVTDRWTPEIQADSGRI